MFRFVLCFIFSVASYNWALNEVELYSPELGEIVREHSTKLAIPTHDSWPIEEAQDLAEGLLESFSEAE